ncbi:MAG: phage holin family protein [Anaerolineales bacterium]|nr:phage holin family protein [Anaerolineales bacterium]
MTKFILRWAINAAALYVAVIVVPGIQMQSSGSQQWVAFIVLGLIFGLLNALLRPLIVLLTCPLIILTLGLGTLLINTFLFYLTGVVGTQFGWGFTVDGFLPAFLGALVVSVVSVVLSLILKDELKPKRRD